MRKTIFQRNGLISRTTTVETTTCWCSFLRIKGGQRLFGDAHRYLNEVLVFERRESLRPLFLVKRHFVRDKRDHLIKIEMSLFKNQISFYLSFRCRDSFSATSEIFFYHRNNLFVSHVLLLLLRFRVSPRLDTSRETDAKAIIAFGDNFSFCRVINQHTI